MKVVDFDNQGICYIIVFFFFGNEEEWTGVLSGIFEIPWSKRANTDHKRKENERRKNAIHVSRKCKHSDTDDGWWLIASFFSSRLLIGTCGSGKCQISATLHNAHRWTMVNRNCCCDAMLAVQKCFPCTVNVSIKNINIYRAHYSCFGDCFISLLIVDTRIADACLSLIGWKLIHACTYVRFTMALDNWSHCPNPDTSEYAPYTFNEHTGIIKMSTWNMWAAPVPVLVRHLDT